MNHTADEHPYFRHAEQLGRRSPYYDFYERDPAGRPTHYFQWTNLPNLDFDHPEVRRMVAETFAHWVRRFDVDGFRVDVAWGVEQRAPDFWPELRRELQRIKPDLLMLAEASAREPYWARNGFDAAYDWTWEHGQWAWDAAFRDDESPDLEALRAALTVDDEGFPGGRVFRFLENNDTGERFRTRHGDALHDVALTLLLTLPGLPGLYTGAEVGAAFDPYQQEAPLDFSANPEAAEPLRRLIALRRAEPALRAEGLTLVPTDHDDQVLAYLRHGAGRPVLVVLNFGEAPLKVRLDLPDGFAEAFAGADDLLGGPAGGLHALPLPAHGRVVLAPALP